MSKENRISSVTDRHAMVIAMSGMDDQEGDKHGLLPKELNRTKHRTQCRFHDFFSLPTGKNRWVISDRGNGKIMFSRGNQPLSPIPQA
jgi:hypothetical protein